MRNIQTIQQLHALQNKTYVYAVIVAVLIFAVAWIIANAIPYKGGKDHSYVSRRIWLIITVAVGSVAFWLYNEMYVMDYIQQVAFQNQFSATNMKCLGITIGGSFGLSLIVMLCFRSSKFGSILGKRRNN